MSRKTQNTSTKENTENLDVIQVKHFCSSEDTKDSEKARQNMGKEFCDTSI